MNWSCSAIGCTNRDMKETRIKGTKFYLIQAKIEGKTVVKFNK